MEIFVRNFDEEVLTKGAPGTKEYAQAEIDVMLPFVEFDKRATPAVLELIDFLEKKYGGETGN